MLSPDEAIERLQSPWAAEAYSPLTGEALLVIRFEGDDDVAPGPELEGALAALAQLPCPSAALAGGRLSGDAEGEVESGLRQRRRRLQ